MWRVRGDPSTIHSWPRNVRYQKEQIKKQQQQRKCQQQFQAPITHRQGNSLSVVEFLPGFLSHIIFNIFFPKNFQRWCLYCSYIIILDTKLFNVFAIFNLVSWQTSWRIALNDVKRILPVLFQMQNIESPPSAAYMKEKKCFSANSITTSLSWNSSFVRKEHKERFLRPKIESTFYYFNFSSTVGVMTCLINVMIEGLMF